MTARRLVSEGGAASELGRWAASQYDASLAQPPLRGAVFTVEELESHARALASSARHRGVGLRSGDKLIRRLADSERVIARCHDLLSFAHDAGRRLMPAADWLLDNHFLIEEQVDLARRHYPRDYSRRLPKLSGDRAGVPRTYDLFEQFIAHVDGRVDDEALARYTAAYQAVTPLTLGELWSVAIMLRLALIENLRRVAVRMSWQRAHRDLALSWARRLDAPFESHEGALLMLADMVRENPVLSTAFVAQFTKALVGRGATASFVVTWLEQRLAERGQTIDEMIRSEHQAQAADQASMSNTVASLRLVNATRWHDFVETHSGTEAILRAEPAGVYAQMDFPTRDTYRHVVEAQARRFGVDEPLVARTAVGLAAERFAAAPTDRSAHVGFVLIGAGRRRLEQALRGHGRARPLPRPLARGLELAAYLGPVVLLSVAGILHLLGQMGPLGPLARAAVVLCAAVAASQFALAVVNWAASLLVKPRALPRMDFEGGIAEASRTLVVVPTLLIGPDRVAPIIEGLERRYLANRDPNLWFALVTDFTDADEAHVEGDDALVAAAAAGIADLNVRYGNGAHGRFFLFHRPRLFNPREGCWMGRERKRGKIEDLNALLRGEGRDRFSHVVGDVSRIESIRYVITLDTDTELPWGAGWRLVGAAAHPLNRPTMDPERRRLVAGYAILQPRVSVSHGSAVRTPYARLLAGDLGIDPYTRVVSDVYQDLFAETSFIGKGIYDVGAFRQLLDGRFPDNAVLSHDLLESCYARSGQCSDVELLEDTPPGYLADVSRRHRWTRGDWQLAPWLGLRVSDALGRRVRSAIAALGRWKILDNLRRTFVAPAYTALLVLVWLATASPLAGTVAILSLLFGPELLPALADLVKRPPKLPRWMHLRAVARSTGRRLAKLALWVTFLPFEAFVGLDAAVRSLWRMSLSHRHLLEWQTAAAVESAAAPGLLATLRRMWVGPGLALAVGAALIAQGALPALAVAGPVLVTWLASPLVAYGISRPQRLDASPLGEADLLFLRRLARRTWRYFEVFIGPQDCWLPPDNFQERPDHRVAHRTSPTDMGMALLSSLSAHDLGYLSGGQLLDRTEHAVDSMEQLERYRGHFYNWYETTTRRPMRPLYVSTVDSGNLVGHVRVLATGLLELAAAPLLPANALRGLQDTLSVLAEHVGETDDLAATMALLEEPAVERTTGLTEGLTGYAHRLRGIAVAAARLGTSCDRSAQPEARWWAAAFERQIGAFIADLTELAPWLAAGEGLPDGPVRRLFEDLDHAPDLRTLGHRAQDAAVQSITLAQTPLERRVGAAFAEGAARIEARLGQIERLAARCGGLTDAEFGFLYDGKLELLSIGFWVADRRLDDSAYDLLASEARLASYLAIASGQLPYDHWFVLGRRLTTTRGGPVLLSWSGSMFEYLMPLLVMPQFGGTLLDQTCRVAVTRQIEYGRQRGTPWGISESCYQVTDREGTYQYRAFGVPGLGLQRGLADDLVVSPYATALALLVDPRGAMTNLRRLDREGAAGPYGHYEALDYTPQRAPPGERAAVVATFMAHHQGMSLLAFGQVLTGPRMQARFLANPDLRAAALLLQERIPKPTALLHPHVREAQISRRIVEGAPDPAVRVVTHPNAPVPELQVLSNGRYHVMVSASGAGYSRWNHDGRELALTRWREDATVESHGVFCFVTEPSTGHCWSNAFQPTLRAGRGYEAIFSPGRAELRRHDDQVETHTTIAVSPEDDVEVRRIRLVNRSANPRALVVTAYAEIVLAPGITDEQHRAFSNLFVTAEPIPALSAILFTRRPRDADERPPWMVCMAIVREHGAEPCSFGTDRARFIGRGRTLRHPAALDDTQPLAGHTGGSLDPCAAFRQTVRLPVDGSVQLDLVLGAAPTREAALALVAKYQDHRMADRVLETAATHSRAVLAQLGATASDALRYAQLAAAVVFPITACRAGRDVLQRNRKGQSGLWAYGISGDLPIVLLRVSSTEHLPLVRDLLRAHALWRLRGLRTDLVVWNEDGSGYRRDLDDQIRALIAAGAEGQLLDSPGGIFLRHIDAFPEEDRVLLQAVARIVVRDADGSLEQQLARWQQASVHVRPTLLPAPRGPASARAAAPVGPVVPDAAGERADLMFANGYGGFTPDGREYIVELPPGRRTPAPWVNVIANPRLGTVISERGSAYTWYGNAQMNRLTPWSNDAVGDPSGEVIYVRDEAAGRSFSPMPWPGSGSGGYTTHHGFGYSRFEHVEEGLRSTLTTYVAVAAPVKFLVLKLSNTGPRSLSLAIFAAFDLVLGDLRSRQGMHVVTELDGLTGAILARNSYSAEHADTVAFLDCSEAVRTVSGDRAEILGRNGDASNPAVLRLRRLSGRLGPGLDPCAAMHVQVDLAAGAEREIVFVFGAANSVAEAASLVQAHRGVAAARVALEAVWRFWNDTLGVLHVETPDPALDVLVNGWLPYQVLACRMWGRSGFFQSGGAFGFRDQLQDCVALLHEVPELAREHIVRCAGRQFEDGDVQHWWHPPGGRGVRTNCSDDYLWLPYAVCRYVQVTGDADVLDERIPYLTGRTLGEHEESYYDLPGQSEQVGTLYDHCARALARGEARGAHGLPLMGGGDWNDGMNRVGHLGRGESVWLGFFQHEVLERFAELADRRADAALARRCRATAAALVGPLETEGWDGAWYRRAFFDDGQPMGSAESVECRIDSLPQSWATIAGVGTPAHRDAALTALWEKLVRPADQLVRLFTPPFDRSPQEPGYVKGYPPGVRENGGQYTHAAIWAAWALALAGRTEQAVAVASMLHPIGHASDPAAVARYQGEPYVVAADVYSVPPLVGRGGWTWYTGSAAWLYRLLHEVVLGIDRRGDTMTFRPRVPADWTGFKVHYREGRTFYHLDFVQTPALGEAVTVTLDGQVQRDHTLHLVDDRGEHSVEVRFGPVAPPALPG